MPKKPLILIIAIIIFLLILFTSSIVTLLTDWFWFQQIGYQNIFTKILGTKILTGVLVGVAAFGLVFLSLKVAFYFTKGRPAKINIQGRETPLDLEKYITGALLPISLVIGFLAGLAGAGSWQTVLKYLNAVPFGTQDPIFHRDISFYFFTLPFLEIIFAFLLTMLFICLVSSVLTYLVRGAFSFSKQSPTFSQDSLKGKLREPEIEKKPRIHLSLLLAFLLLVLAGQAYFIKIPNLLYSSDGLFTGAGFTDLNAHLPVLKLLAILLVIGAILAFANIFKKNYRFLLLAAGFYIVVAILGGWAYPLILQKFIVAPNELAKEHPYIVHNIEATQKAFKLDQIEERNLSGETVLTMKDIQENQGTIKNVRLWDREPLLDTFGQVQEIRTYYDFVSIDNDRYEINNEYRQVLLSPRELNTESLPNPTFINKRLAFTHGFGLTLGPVNEVTKEGLPLLFIKDLPPVSTSESIRVNQPEIYFGELTKDHVFVKTKAKEFDYPAGEENVFTDYKGDGGVPVNSALRKALFAARFGELKILLSEDITHESRAMYYRDIKERVERVLPFLVLDQDPYLVVTEEGRLKWICDAYTESNNYPYAQSVDGPRGINYMRNSVKAVIDAYDGKMQFYIADPDDPLIQTYAKIFEDAFSPLDKMPEDLKKHLRYPEDIFTYQTQLYTSYHMEEPQIFYNKEDKWQVPSIAEGASDPMMRHIIMKLPGEEKEEFILMIPFTPQGKDNLSSWMVARADGDNYGKLAVYRFPKQKLVFGPKQIINRINQDPEISRQLSLWDQRGSQVNQGLLLVIPVEESLLYVRPLYIRAEGGKIPELKRVIVAYKDKIAMEETLDQALNQIFGRAEEEPEEKLEEKDEKVEPKEPTKEELILKAEEHYNAAIQAQKEGNWARYGEEIQKLGDILEKLK